MLQPERVKEQTGCQTITIAKNAVEARIEDAFGLYRCPRTNTLVRFGTALTHVAHSIENYPTAFLRTYGCASVARRLPLCSLMDIARPEFKTQKRRRQMVRGAPSWWLRLLQSRLEFHDSSRRLRLSERGTVWTDTVEARPDGSAGSRDWLSGARPRNRFARFPAETEATVVRIRMLPGSQVEANTILLEMSNPRRPSKPPSMRSCN